MSAAERGYQWLTTKAFLPADFDQEVFDNLWKVWPAELREKAARAAPDERRRMAFSRYGLVERPDSDGTGPALGYVADGKGGWVMNCLACHTGKVAGRLVLDDSPLRRGAAGRALEWLGDYSHLFNRVSALVPRRFEPQERSWRQRKREVLSDADYAFRLTFALILEMRDECRRRGIAFLVATFPNGVSYELRPPMQERLHEALRAEGAWVLDLGARFQALGLTPAELALDDVGHLAPRGHHVACELLEREIASRSGRPGR